jgi:protein TonB
MSDLALASGHTQVDRNDPWRAVFSFGEREMKVGWVIGLVLALGTHGFASARAMLALYDMQRSVDSMRLVIHEFLWTEYDVEPEEKKVEPEQKKAEEPPPPEPDPEPIAQPKLAEPPKDPYDEPPKAAPVQAAKILTANPDPNEVRDLTDLGIVSGDNTTGPLGGQSSAVGTSNVITHNAAVSNTGKPGGTGTAEPAAPPPPKVDLSKPPSLLGGASWNCPFPDEAETDQIDYAQPIVVITVRPDGTAQSAQVTSDPGHGFGRAARMCALSRKYNAGLDRDGKPATVSFSVRITFSR